MAAALVQAAAAAAVTPRGTRSLARRAAPFTSSQRPAARRSVAQHLPRASAGSDEQQQQPGQPPADEEQQAGGAALGPRDDDVLPDSLTGALEDASRATVEALERGVDRCVVSASRGDVDGRGSRRAGLSCCCALVRRWGGAHQDAPEHWH